MENSIIVDSHCHLNLGPLTRDLDSIIQKAHEKNVKILNTICTCKTDIDEISDLVKKDPIFASIGIHPNNVDDEEFLDSQQIIHALSFSEKFIGIGETGLDYYRQASTDDKLKKLQKKSFLEHIKASQVIDVPLIIHTRECDKDMKDILISEFKNKYFRGLLHSFNSSIDLARCALDLGMYISLSGILTFKNASTLREIVAYLPMDRILVETDSPYLAPDPLRGQINNPAFVIHVIEKIAHIKNLTYSQVAKCTTDNFINLFKCSSLLDYYNSINNAQ